MVRFMTNQTASVVEHERELSAPCSVVFDLLLDAGLIRDWLGYEGAELRSLWLDPRPGGGFHACLVVPYLGDVWAIGTYRDVERPTRIVFDLGIKESVGEAVGTEGGDPSTGDVRVTITLAAAGAGTRVTVERETAVSPPRGMPTWTRMLDVVEESLAKRKPR